MRGRGRREFALLAGEREDEEDEEVGDVVEWAEVVEVVEVVRWGGCWVDRGGG